jgi:membrane protein YqaA with SNARE-associated domain
MSRVREILHGIAGLIQQFAERAGGPGLFVVAFLDSSFLSLPEIADLLVVVFVLNNPDAWLYYAAITTAGSIGGCYALYSVGRRGGEAFLRRRFSERRIERALGWFRRNGLLAVIVPSILPPPTPFKIFVLLAGVARVRPVTFVGAVAIGRGFRYGSEAFLAYLYGERATKYIGDNLAAVSYWIAGAVLVGGVATLVWRRRRRFVPGAPATVHAAVLQSDGRPDEADGP